MLVLCLSDLLRQGRGLDWLMELLFWVGSEVEMRGQLGQDTGFGVGLVAGQLRDALAEADL